MAIIRKKYMMEYFSHKYYIHICHLHPPLTKNLMVHPLLNYAVAVDSVPASSAHLYNTSLQC